MLPPGQLEVQPEIGPSGNGTVSYTYDSMGNVLSQTVSSTSDLARPHEIMITGTSDGTDSNSGAYSYDGSGNITAIGALDYQYDLLNRLTSGEARAGTAGIQTQTVSFDKYGNITSMTTAGQTRTLTTDASTNRLSGAGITYDEAGNLTTATVDGFNFQYTYDGLNSMKFYQSQSESKVFSYDADGERLETFRCPANLCGEGEGNERFTLRGLNGEVLRIYEGETGNRRWVEDYVYANGRPLARIRADAGGESVEFLHLDHLGSVRKVTDEDGAEVTTHEFYPFGEETTAPAPGDSKLKFTGHERDDGSGSSDELDYMHARFCGPRLGRFLSPDPILQLERTIERPQLWNRFTQSVNSPLNYVDPTGETVKLSNLDEDDRNLLIEELEKITGLDLEYDSQTGNLLISGQGTSSSGQPTSKLAAQDLQDAIGSSKDYWVLDYSNKANVDMGERVGPHIRLDFADIAKVDSGRNDPLTFGAGMIFLHELKHAQGLKDPPKPALKSIPTMKGDTVIHMNKIREEIGLSIRYQYATKRDSRGHYLPFASGPIRVPMEIQ